MNRLLTVSLLLAVSALAGCVSNSPELRPYTDEESRELAMESLNRSGLSFDEYHAKKAQLLGRTQFDKKAEMSAERAVQLHGRAS